MLHSFDKSIVGQNEIQVQMDSNWLDSHKAFKKTANGPATSMELFSKRSYKVSGMLKDSSTTCCYYNLKHSQLVPSIYT